ncbi:hypothetical protein PVL29_008420 [Vitis rotundifolia]|uniref:FLZ-type domain-containing protein n=1 Tax=Vitis rotundifolia TaxID=103349 RepID=A0AA38ZVU3_VITRO|nr:hypothetical protein PVL29_008420 [Vitis rotundifolia]
MLRNRSRAVTSKQAIMGDHSSLPCPTENLTKPISFLLGSPKIFRGFMAKGLPEAEEIISQRRFLILNPFLETHLKTKRSWENLDSIGIGVALIDSDPINGEGANENFSKPNSRMVLFGSQLKVQIPHLQPSALSPAESPKSPADFGIKTRNSQLASLSPFGSLNSGIQTKDSPRIFTGMELSEEYTCVISHGPNPRTTHIFDNCIVESCCGVSALSQNNYCTFPENPNSPPGNFLSCCHTCKKNLSQERDIYMYRGEKAFCSHECRCQEMLFDEEEDSEF